MEQEEKELLEIIEKYNHGEYPMITEVDFCSCLFSYLKLKGISQLDISKLEDFIQKKLDLEKFRFIFADIDSAVIHDLCSYTSPIVYIHYSKEQALEVLLQTPEVYCGYIEEFAEEFQNLSLTSNLSVKSLEKSLS